jgi:hypothetical protein
MSNVLLYGLHLLFDIAQLRAVTLEHYFKLKAIQKAKATEPHS